MTTTATTTETSDKTTAMLATRNVGAIENVASKCNLAALVDKGRFERAFMLANGVKALRKLLSGEAMEDIMALQNTALGFRTDKPGPGYDETIVREALIEATIRGVYPVGNEFNIIAGRCYVTKEGFTRLLRDYPGLTNLRITLGVPLLRDGGAVVKCAASWHLDGNADSIECEIPIRVNNGMGADAILGKAERKLRARIWNHITGSIMETPDGEAGEAPVAKPSTKIGGTEAVRQKLGLPAGTERIDHETGEVVDGCSDPDPAAEA